MRFATIIGPSRVHCSQGNPASFRVRAESAHRGGQPRGLQPRPASRPASRVERLRYIAFTISSTIFFASANSIMVLSRKKSSFSMPA